MTDMSLGERLKQAREDKKLTLKQVVDDTNITLRHIEALENDNYSIFPGRTYVLGFIKNYAAYLGFDPDELVQLYKNEMLMKSEMPLEELTKPSVTNPDKILYYLRFAIIPVSVIFLILVLYKLFSSSSSTVVDKKDHNYNGYNIEQYLVNSGKIPSQKTESVQVHNNVVNALISVDKGIDFPIKDNDKQVYFILNEIKYKNLEGELSQAIFTIFPGKINLILTEAKTSILKIDEIQKTLNIDLIGATPNNIKININITDETVAQPPTQVVTNTQPPVAVVPVTPATKLEDSTKTKSNVSTNSAPANQTYQPDAILITLDIKTTRQNYVEFYVDGQQKRKGLMQAGESLHFEGNDTIQMKIGDAGVVELFMNGKTMKTGRKGQQINRVIRKIKDPMDQSKFKIEVKDS